MSKMFVDVIFLCTRAENPLCNYLQLPLSNICILPYEEWNIQFTGGRDVICWPLNYSGDDVRCFADGGPVTVLHAAGGEATGGFSQTQVFFFLFSWRLISPQSPFIHLFRGVIRGPLSFLQGPKTGKVARPTQPPCPRTLTHPCC